MSKLIIEVHDQQKRISLDPAQITRVAKKVLRSLKVSTAQLSIAFVTDQNIKKLNKQYLQHDFATDVLAFDLREPAPEGSQRKKTLALSIEGEIIISTVTAARNAKEFKTSPQQEVVLYLIHGILHLLGYDDHSTAEIKRMRLKEKELMGVIGRDC